MAEKKVAWDNQPLDEKVNHYATETAYGFIPEMIPFLNATRGFNALKGTMPEIEIINMERQARQAVRTKPTLFKKRVDVPDKNFKINIGYRGRNESAKTIPKEINIEGKSGKWQVNRNADGTFGFSANMSNPLARYSY
jgi:hypothetical protein